MLAFVALPLAGVLAQQISMTPAGPAPDPYPPNTYQIDQSFKLEMPKGITTLGGVVGGRVSRDGKYLYVFHRCAENSCATHPDVPPILKYDMTGKLVKAWGQGMIVFPHGLYIDPDDNIWVTDAVSSYGTDPDANGRGQQALKFDPEGKLLMTLGTKGVAGQGHNTFFAPSDVVTGRNGDIFVADGHGGDPKNPAGWTNNRVVKFDKNGKYIKEWGGRGSGPGQFEVPHAITIDSRGRLFVADRMNNRIQIFDQDGKFLEEWKQFGRPSGLYIGPDDQLYAADTQSPANGKRTGWKNGVYIGSAKDGKVTAFIPKHVDGSNMEGIGANANGSIVYGGDIGIRQLVIFRRGGRSTR